MTERTAPSASAGARLWHMPYLLMVMPPLFWSGNFVLGRAVAGHVPPIGLAFWRWAIGCLLVLPLAWPHLRRDLPALRAHWGIVLVLSAVGIAAFNSFVYVGLNRTTALNAVMMQSTMPVLIVLMSFMLFRQRISALGALGIGVSLAGVAAIVGRGDPAAFAGLDLNLGDVWVFAAVVSYSAYTALLRRKPAAHPFSFLAVTFGLGALMLVPFYAWETATVRPVRPDLLTVAAIAYVALFPSILAYLCYNRSVELIGANRTGLSIHLMPVFGSVMAMLFLGERLSWYHGLGIVLIAAGIALANRRED